MKTLKLSFWGYLLLLLVAISCNKKESLSPNDKGKSGVASQRLLHDPETTAMTVLGRQKGNPYTVSTMTEAWNSLYNVPINLLPTTDVYVRFLPHSDDELAQLIELGFDLTDTPMEYEIDLQGNHYHDPTVPAHEITWQYCVVKPNRALPNIEHEILAELFLAADGLELTRVAFYLVGEAPSDYEPYVQNGGNGGNVGENPPCSPEDPGFPDCIVNGTDPNTPPWTGPPAGGGGVTPTTACGCPVNSNVLYPAGGVKVEDTQLASLVGVKRVTVKASNGWFTSQKVETNDNGCFQFTKSFESPFDGDYHGMNGVSSIQSIVHLSVEFENSRAAIRGLNEWTINKVSQIVKDNNYEFAGAFNNICIEYNQDKNAATNNSEQQRLWAAATVQNAVQEFFAFAAQENIGLPPTQLKILTTTFTNAGAAPMAHKILQTSVISNVTWATYLSVVLIRNGSLAAIGASIVGATLHSYAPDVMVGYDIVAGQVMPTAFVKEIAYHEMAHAAHFGQVGNNMWLANIGYIAAINDFNNPYGDGTLAGAGRCAIIESWGYHIGHFFTDLQYGQAHCQSPIVNQANTALSLIKSATQSSNIVFLEEYNPNLANDATRWMPIGVMWDLIDNTPNENFPVDDDANGFSNQQFFNALTSNVQSPVAFRNMLLSQNGNNQQTQVNDLFQGYGY